MGSVKPWDGRWRNIVHLATGGQGSARRVERADGGPGAYVLKTLNRQHDLERRARMFREAAALQTLSHGGIPAFIETNAAEFRDPSVPLYIVTEYVAGPTLEQAVTQAALPFQSALGMAERLVAVLHYCHTRGIRHRDIKPDNLILRGGHPEDPVVIDFGQSFNEEAVPDLTATGEQVGNRFLSLPEFLTSGSDQRDTRSDVTQVCGVFLFALTGVRPSVLVDSSGALPHQRPGVGAQLALMPNHRRLLRLFDRAFATRIDQRWQSAHELAGALRALDRADPPFDLMPYDELLSVAEKHFGTTVDAIPAAARHAAITRIYKALLSASLTAAGDLNGQCQGFNGGHSIKAPATVGTCHVGLVAKHDDSLRFTRTFVIESKGNEFVIAVEGESEDGTSFRLPSQPEPSIVEFGSEVRRYLVAGFLKAIAVR